MCQTLQNVKEDTQSFKARWLEERDTAPGTYVIGASEKVDLNSTIDVDIILKRKSAAVWELPKEASQRIKQSLNGTIHKGTFNLNS